MKPSRLVLLALPGLLLALAPARSDDEAKKDDTAKTPPKAKAKEPARKAAFEWPGPQRLVGKPAPGFAGAEFALNGKPVALDDLKGKVVLLDFWAVWCGPCIATFPHLRDWNSEFKDAGLEIVGVTSYYEAYTFDKAAGKVGRAKEPVPAEKEQEMLRDFAAHHRLDYRLVAYPQSEIKAINASYRVIGIPEAVLIDRKGVVRMVKVGSGDENAKALHAEIRKLIDEKP